MNPAQTPVIIVGASTTALITALLLHKAQVPVTLVHGHKASTIPLNPELMLLGSNDQLPMLFQTALAQWRGLSELLKLPPILNATDALDLATSPGRQTKLEEEAMLDALGGESVSYGPAPEWAPGHILGVKTSQNAPVLVPNLHDVLEEAVTNANIPVLPGHPQSLSVANPAEPELTLENGRKVQGRLVFTGTDSMQRLLSPLGLSLPMRPARGHIISLQLNAAAALPLILHRLQRGHLFLVPTGENTLDLHYDAVNDPAQATANRQPSGPLVAALHQHVQGLVPMLAGSKITNIRTATHWLTPDFLPALGDWPGLEGLFLSVGWGGRKSAFAAGAAAKLVEMLVNPGATPFKTLLPNRFGSGHWEAVKGPGSLLWAEPTPAAQPQIIPSSKPEYMSNVAMAESPNTQYANNVQQTEKVVQAPERKPGTIVIQEKGKRKIQTAALKKPV